jgi:hypothetical protein
MKSGTVEGEYENLGKLYRALWKRLDNVSGEDKWLDIRPIGDDRLKASIQATLLELRATLGESQLLSEAIKDCETTEKLLSDYGRERGTKLDEFREYLRDRGLRYAQRTMSAPVEQ